MPERQYTIMPHSVGDNLYWMVQVYRRFRPYGFDRSYWQDIALCTTERQAESYIEGKQLELTDAQGAALDDLYNGRHPRLTIKVKSALQTLGLIEAGPYYRQFILTDKGQRIADALINAQRPPLPDTYPEATVP